MMYLFDLNMALLITNGTKILTEIQKNENKPQLKLENCEREERGKVRKGEMNEN